MKRKKLYKLISKLRGSDIRNLVRYGKFRVTDCLPALGQDICFKVKSTKRLEVGVFVFQLENQEFRFKIHGTTQYDLNDYVSLRDIAWWQYVEENVL